MKRNDDPSAEHYAHVGRSALESIGVALRSRERTFDDVSACLDLACGYGRVVRFLQLEVPPERVTACDIDRRAVAFCADEFGVRPLRSDPDFEALKAGGRYDLIWSGSLVTHLSEPRFHALVRRLAEVLVPGGVVVLTTHGEDALEDVSRYGAEFGPLRDEIEEAVRTRGFVHFPYENARHDWGCAWHSRRYVEDAFTVAFGDSVVPVLFRPRGWDDHQDVIALQRSEAPTT